VAADFSKNGIGASGATQLCQVLGNNSGLRTLLLDTNALGDEGAAMLATVSGWAALVEAAAATAATAAASGSQRLT
jgi:hypothetical protein